MTLRSLFKSLFCLFVQKPGLYSSINQSINMSFLSSFMRTSLVAVCLHKLCLFFLAPPAPVIITPGLEQEDGWIIIQRRVDCSVSFERSWDNYVAGFGDIDGNFWLGLETTHDLTTAQPMRLQIDVVPFYITALSIPYQQFHVGDAASEYLLTITHDTPANGWNLYNSFIYHSGMKFSTYDRDNDNYGRSCAEQFRAGWWFNGCFKLNVNGVYGGASDIRNHNMNIYFLGNNNQEPIRTVTM